jgi:predicted ATPase
LGEKSFTLKAKESRVPQLKAMGGLKLEGSTFTRPLPLLLLSYLSLEGSQQRKHLAELFWQDGNRMKSLSMTLTRLRQGAGEVVAGDQQKIWATVGSDVKELLETLDKSEWQKASELYTGAFLEGVMLDDWGSELEDWVYTTREYLAERVQHALLNLAEEAAKEQDFRGAGGLAERAYKIPGLSGNEPNTLKRLYTLLCAGGNLRAPDVRKEAHDYGLTLELTKQAAREMFEPSSKTTTLPVRGTSFVGRDEELTELATLLSKPNVSLLTLLGPAGVGKTRLALQLSHEQQKLGAFKDGVHFISLDALNDASLLPSSLLGQLGLTQQGKTEPLTQIIDFLADKTMLLVLDNFEHLIEGSSLLSELTNKCPNLKLFVTSRERLNLEEEHLYALEGLPYPKELSDDATLSDAVQLFKERAQQVQARFQIDEHVADVINVCKLVEGLPLGLELAASWVRLMSCKEIAAEIERGLELLSTSSKNVPERHRSLKAAFEQSWKFLSTKEQEVLRKLSVFVGGFRREAASDVVGATIPVLASLVDKSLLKVLPNGRYDRHPLLYQFTKEKLAECVDEKRETQAHHARYYQTFTELANSRLNGKDQVTWFAQLDEELENLREALTFLETKEDVSEALVLATSLGYFWDIRGYYGEGIRHFMMLLEKIRGHTPLRAKAYAFAGDLLFKQSEYQTAQHIYEQGLECAKNADDLAIQADVSKGLGDIARFNKGEFEAAGEHYHRALDLAKENGDKSREADALRSLAGLSSARADYKQARTFYEKAVQLYDDVDNPHNRAKCLVSLATVLTYLGESQEAHALNMTSLELFRVVGDKYGMGIALLNLGKDAGGEGKPHKVMELYQESLEIFRSLGSQRMVSHLLNNVAGSFQKLGEAHKAKPLLEESLAIQRQVGDVSLIAHALLILGTVHYDLTELQQARQIYQECIALCRKHEDNWALMRVLESSAKLYIQQHDYEHAETELNEALALAEQAGDKNTLRKILETRNVLELVLEGLGPSSSLSAQNLSH